jgi:hypothetical protein
MPVPVFSGSKNLTTAGVTASKSTMEFSSENAKFMQKKRPKNTLLRAFDFSSLQEKPETTSGFLILSQC